MYLTKTPWWLRAIYPSSLVWNLPTEDNEIFLTFDDGPHPVATPFVLDCLIRYNAKATFFCIGKNVEQQPALYRRIIDEGHKVGNHTYNHLNGWKTNDKEYFDDITKAAGVIDSKLFRPPYGRISRFQIQQLQKVFSITMWDVLSGDWDANITKEKCLSNVMDNANAGSIIVFHDSAKAFKHLEYVLPKVLEAFSAKQYRMIALQEPLK